MKFLVLISSALLACVSSVPLDAGYGLPAAPVLSPVVLPNIIPQRLFSHPVAAPLPVQLLNAAPLPAPVQFASPAPFSFAQAPFPLAAAPAPFQFAAAPAPLQLASAPFPLAAAPVPFSASPLPFAPAPVAVAPPVAPSSQFHAQDEFGQFSFGYENINSRKTETKDAFGVTRGSYQYVDANGVLQTTNYVSDPINGFRVAGTNIPNAQPLIAPSPVMETPEVAAARAEHLAAHEKLKAAVATSERRKRSAKGYGKRSAKGYGKREAEVIEADYSIPAAPVLIPAAHTPIFFNQPTIPAFTAPAPIAPLPFSSAPAPFRFVAAPAPLQFAAPSAPFQFAAQQAPLPFAAAPAQFAAPTPFPFAQAPLPLAAAPAPFQFAAAPAPLQLAPAPFSLPLAAAPVPFAASPLPFAPAPVAVAPHTAPSSQFHAQDEFGQFSFGYENINSRKTETKDAFGVTRGSYQYVDANGVLQTVNYVADPVNGFRVAGTNIPVAPAAPNAALPVGPAVPVVEPLIAPIPVMETPEVAAATAEHLAAHEALKEAAKKVEDTTEAKKVEDTTEEEL